MLDFKSIFFAEKTMLKIRINGIVQGVGFRPFVYRLASELNLKGYVLNSNSGVIIEIVGSEKNLNNFVSRIKSDCPPAALIKEIKIEKRQDIDYNSFEIRKSDSDHGSTLISPDLAICEDCLREFSNPSDPRYHYPFINCTNCGPRYSIIENTPYDRQFTSMKHFQMCNFCSSEYSDPLNRRFHAQPIACPECGPQLRFLNNNFSEIAGDPISNTIKFLKQGKIIGIKGIGGFHIACDASNYETVAELRRRKHRPDKPFAVMCSRAKISEIVQISNEQIQLLKSPSAPILILPKKHKNERIAENVAPKNPNLGVFFPYAPYHYQIIGKDLPFLVMTSGNISDEPLADDEKKLENLCDYYLTHNRAILNRSDDSVILPAKSANIIIRRSRGFVPRPLKLPFFSVPTIGCGAELKLTFAISKQDNLFLSPYLGNSGNKETLDFYLETLEKYQKWFRIKPEVAACDLQPDFFTTGIAENFGLPLFRIQHHFAHIAAIMAEHNISEPVIGVAYDGTGYGTDEAIWGGEIFVCDYSDFTRVFHLNYMPLPGGDAAIRHPIRIAFSYLQKSGINSDFLKNISDKEKNIIQKQLEKNFNVFQTSSMGRLFDCIAALLGLFPRITFEAQSAMALEFLCANESLSDCESYPFEIKDNIIDITPLIKGVVSDIQKHKNHKTIAKKFHKTVIDFTWKAVRKTAKIYGLKKVVLGGGVMQNRIILDGLADILKRDNFSVFVPRQLPPNDGSISAGQVAIANHKIG